MRRVPVLFHNVLPLTSNKTMSLPMPEPGFTVAETGAFDRGVADGELRGMDAENPFDSVTHADEWDAWENGVSVGRVSGRG